MNTIPRSALLFDNRKFDSSELKPATQTLSSIDNRLESFIETIQTAKGQKERDQREASSEAMAKKPSMLSGFGEKTKKIIGSLVGKLGMFALVVLTPLVLPLIVGLNNAFPQVHKIFEGVGLAIRDPAKGLNVMIEFFFDSLDKIKSTFEQLANATVEIIDNIARMSEIIFSSMKAELLNMSADAIDKLIDPNSRIGRALKAVGADKPIRAASSRIRASATAATDRADDLRASPPPSRTWRDTNLGRLATGEFGRVGIGPRGMPTWLPPDKATIKAADARLAGRSRSSVSPEMKALLDYIGKYEGPAGYSGVYGDNESPTWPDLQTKTLREAMRMQSLIRKPVSKGGLGRESSAMGRYQFMPNTLNGLINSMGLNPDTEIFDADLQDRMAIALMKQQGLNKFLLGKMSSEDFQLNLSKIWAALPVPRDTVNLTSGRAISAGESYYGGVGANRSETPARTSDLSSRISGLRSATTTSIASPVQTVPRSNMAPVLPRSPPVTSAPFVVMPSMPAAKRPQTTSGSRPIDPNAARDSYRAALGN